MNILLFLHAAAFIINFFLANYILIKDPKSLLNRSCSALLLCFALWNFCEIFMRNSAISHETATVFLKISAFAWMGGPSLFFITILVFTEKQYILKKIAFYPLLLIWPALFIYRQWTGADFITLVIHPHYGWVNGWNNSVWTYTFYPYIILLYTAALFLILRFRQKNLDRTRKKQASLILATSFISILAAGSINIFLPQIGIQDIPPAGDIFLLIWSFGLVYSMIKYRFFEISPAAAAREIITTIPDCLILLNKTGNITTVNRRTMDLLGYTEKELTGQPISLLFGREDSASALFGRILGTEDFKNKDLFFKTKDNQFIPVSFSRSLMKDDSGDTAGIVCVATDMTEYKNVEKILSESRQYYRTLVDTSPDIIFNISIDGRINALNPAFEKITGWSIDEWIGKSFLSIIHPDDRPIFTAIARRTMNNEPTPPYELRIITYSSEYLHEEVIITPEYRDEKMLGLIGFAHNITGRKRNEEKLMHLAYHDPLTGLPNRKSLFINLTDLINQANRSGSTGALMYLDIDNFKLINDSYGHDVGDILLKDISDILIKCIRVSDRAYRMGGDEFVLLLNCIAQDDDAGIIAQKIQQAFSKPFTISGNSFYISTSTGIAVFPRDASDAESLLSYADNAMYRAKDLGKNTYQFYNEEINIRAHERLNLRNLLIEAIEKEDLLLYYQPIIKNKKILGAEAILRWFHPDEGYIPPNQFIPIAEESGLINKLGEWVLVTACAKNVEWHNMGYTDIFVSVNISPKQIQKGNLVQIVENALKKTGLQPGYLNLEITESCILEDPDSAIKLMNDLRTMGIKISIDNFGTGFSSLASIKKFPINTLKIDRNFIANIVSDTRDQAIVKATIKMAKGLNMETVIGGIETVEQLNYLGDLECDTYQGYYFCKPLPGDELDEILKKGIIY